MVDFTPLNEILDVFSQLFPVILGIVLFLFVVGLIFALLGAKDSKFARMFKLAFPMLMLGLIIFASASVQAKTESVNALALTIPTEIYVGTPTTVKVSGLTSGTDYVLFNTHDATPTPIVFTASSTKAFLTTSWPAEGDNNFLLKLIDWNGTTPNTNEAGSVTVVVNLVDASTRLPIDAFFDLMVPLIIIGVVFALVAGFIGTIITVNKSNKRGR